MFFHPPAGEPQDLNNYAKLSHWYGTMSAKVGNTERLASCVGFAFLCLLVLGGCGGPQSTLQPAGKAAERIASLFWWMLAGGVAIWVVIMALALYSVRTHVTGANDRRIQWWIVGGGSVVPTIVLSGLLVFSLPLIPDLLRPAPEDALQVEVRGKMWWWRVRYVGGPEEELVELANEVRLPVGRPVEFQLFSDDVIHAFWVPSLGGKVDMIPGRQTRLKLEPTKTGVFRGVCAEYCGASHALMQFDVIVMPADEFERWLQQQRAAAVPAANDVARRGEEIFFRTGCHACHTIRGTLARGVIAPDLTHVGSRRRLAAGVLENHPVSFAAWIAATRTLKPSAKMPPFHMLSQDELQALAIYLEGLQ